MTELSWVADEPWLEKYPPAVPQWRAGRRDPIKPVTVVHTTESSPSWAVWDLADFIRLRQEPGSYQLTGDAGGRIRWLVDFDNEAFGDRTGSNRWATHMALIMRAAEWRQWTGPDRPARLDALLETAAQMAAIIARWHIAEGRPAPAARLLTKAESDEPDASGFISHARRDPTRRSDPGSGFPWPTFFARYQQLMTGDPTMPTQPITPDYSDQVRAVQTKLVELGLATLDFGSGPIEPADYIDGRFGDTTKNDVIRALTRPATDPDIVAAARNYLDARNKADAAKRATDAALMDEIDAVSNLEEALDR